MFYENEVVKMVIKEKQKEAEDYRRARRAK